MAEFSNRPLESGPYRYLWINGSLPPPKARGWLPCVVKPPLIATLVNVEGRREIVGFRLVTTELPTATAGLAPRPRRFSAAAPAAV